MNKTLLAVYLLQISFIIQYVNFIENTVTAVSFLRTYIITLYNWAIANIIPRNPISFLSC